MPVKSIFWSRTDLYSCPNNYPLNRTDFLAYFGLTTRPIQESSKMPIDSCSYFGFGRTPPSGLFNSVRNPQSLPPQRACSPAMRDSLYRLSDSKKANFPVLMTTVPAILSWKALLFGSIRKVTTSRRFQPSPLTTSNTAQAIPNGFGPRVISQSKLIGRQRRTRMTGAIFRITDSFHPIFPSPGKDATFTLQRCFPRVFP